MMERCKMDPESRPYECVVCHRRFKRKQHLKVHANVHLKQSPTIWCSVCKEGQCSSFSYPYPPKWGRYNMFYIM
jgi:hypothetical protein